MKAPAHSSPRVTLTTEAVVAAGNSFINSRADKRRGEGVHSEESQDWNCN